MSMYEVFEFTPIACPECGASITRWQCHAFGWCRHDRGTIKLLDELVLPFDAVAVRADVIAEDRCGHEVWMQAVIHNNKFVGIVPMDGTVPISQKLGNHCD